jgi:hypothetical protein
VATNSFFNPNSLYGGKLNRDTSGYVLDNLDPQNPTGVYTSYLANKGFGGTDRMSTFARNLYGQTLSGYQAALRTNPALTYRDYLSTQLGKTGGGLRSIWAASTPEQRGEQPNLWQQNARTIAWG